MPSAIVSQTVQGAVLSATSNVLAQVITSYKDNTSFSLSLTPIIKFIIFSIISSPPNIFWQSFLEDLFPTNVPIEPSSETPPKNMPVQTQLSKTNILIKFILDQSIGAVVNTLMFLVFMGYTNDSRATSNVQGAWTGVEREVRDKLWPMIMAGYKFWPFVSLASFVWVPVDKRVVFGASVGVVWGIYLSLMVGS